MRLDIKLLNVDVLQIKLLCLNQNISEYSASSVRFYRLGIFKFVCSIGHLVAEL